MKRFDLIFAGRPILHLPIWSVYLVAFHYHQQLSGDHFGLTDLLVMTGLSLLAAGAYWLNQVYDVETDRINDKLGFLQAGYLSDRTLMAAFVIVSTLSLLLAVWISLSTLVIFSQLFLLGYLYSTPPFRLKDRAFWGLFANAWSFGFLVPLTIVPGLTEHNSGLLGWDNPIYFLYSVGAIYLLTTIPDRDGDRKAGKRTLAVIWPVGLVKLLALSFLAVAAFFAYRSGFAALVYLAIGSMFPVLLALLIPIPAFERAAAKFPVLLLTLLAGALYPIYLVFIVVLIVLTRLYYLRRFKLVYPRLF